MRALIEASRAPAAPAEIVLVLSNNPGAAELCDDSRHCHGRGRSSRVPDRAAFDEPDCHLRRRRRFRLPRRFHAAVHAAPVGAGATG
jgi:hypothetical protein